MLPFDLLAEVRVIYSVASTGSPPFQNTWYYEPSVTPSNPAAEVEELADIFQTAWNANFDTIVGDDLLSNYCDVRMRVAGFVYERLGKPLNSGQRTGTQGAGGASIRITMASQKRIDQRNGCIYLPGVTTNDYNGSTGVVDTTYATTIASSATAMLSLTGGTLEADWDAVTLHKTTETESGYEGSPITSVSVADRVTFYDSRY